MSASQLAVSQTSSHRMIHACAVVSTLRSVRMKITVPGQLSQIYYVQRLHSFRPNVLSLIPNVSENMIVANINDAGSPAF